MITNNSTVATGRTAIGRRTVFTECILDTIVYLRSFSLRLLSLVSPQTNPYRSPGLMSFLRATSHRNNGLAHDRFARNLLSGCCASSRRGYACPVVCPSCRLSSVWPTDVVTARARW